MTDLLTESGTVAQERRLVTELPGPRSRELASRRAGAVASAVGSTLPIYVERAGGGVVVDVDGNSLIDLGSGIAVVGVGNAAPHVVDRVVEQVRAFTHTCFMVTPYDVYVDVCEQLGELTPGDHEGIAWAFVNFYRFGPGITYGSSLSANVPPAIVGA